MEPLPAKGSKSQDKAPATLEDSNNDNKDLVKFVLGGKSLSLAQGSGAFLYHIGLLNFRAKLLTNLYKDIVRVVKKVSIRTPHQHAAVYNALKSFLPLLHAGVL